MARTKGRAFGGPGDPFGGPGPFGAPYPPGSGSAEEPENESGFLWLRLVFPRLSRRRRETVRGGGSGRHDSDRR